jgi:hypothetical protein
MGRRLTTDGHYPEGPAAERPPGWTFAGRVLDPEKARLARPWQPPVATPPTVKKPRFMLGGRLAVIREPSFMHDDQPEDASLSSQSETVKLSLVDSHGK